MSRIAQIALLIPILGIVIGLFILGGLSGMVVGLILSGVIAIPFYCIANVMKANAMPALIDPFSNEQIQTNKDRSQLPKAAYERSSDG